MKPNSWISYVSWQSFIFNPKRLDSDNTDWHILSMSKKLTVLFEAGNPQGWSVEYLHHLRRTSLEPVCFIVLSSKNELLLIKNNGCHNDSHEYTTTMTMIDNTWKCDFRYYLLPFYSTQLLEWMAVRSLWRLHRPFTISIQKGGDSFSFAKQQWWSWRLAIRQFLVYHILLCCHKLHVNWDYYSTLAERKFWKFIV